MVWCLRDVQISDASHKRNPSIKVREKDLMRWNLEPSTPTTKSCSDLPTLPVPCAVGLLRVELADSTNERKDGMEAKKKEFSDYMFPKNKCPPSRTPAKISPPRQPH